MLNAAFAPELGERFSPLRAGRKETPIDEHGALRLFALDPPPAQPPVELLVTGTQGWDELAPRLGLAQGGDQPWRRAEARLIADRLRARARRRPPRRRHGRARPRDRVACGCSRRRSRSRACRPTSSAAAATGRQEQVRDGLAWLRVLANPHDEEALLTVLASPFHGAGTDELVLLDPGRPRARQPVGRASRRRGTPGRAAARRRARARRSARRWRCCSSARSSPPATTSRRSPGPGGDRRLANLRKLMRLAGEYERAEGRDLRGFLADAAGARPRRGARGRGRARVRGPGRRAADDDPPRQGPRVPGRLRRRPRPPVGRLAARRCWSAPTARAGLRLAPLGGGDTIPTTAWDRARRRGDAADAEEERRLFYVAMTRARSC